MHSNLWPEYLPRLSNDVWALFEMTSSHQRRIIGDLEDLSVAHSHTAGTVARIRYLMPAKLQQAKYMYRRWNSLRV